MLFSRTSRSWSDENNITFLPILYRKISLSTDLLACYRGSDYWTEVGRGSLTFASYIGSNYFLDFKLLNFATEEPGKVQVRDLDATVPIGPPLCSVNGV